jgi:hypothetical protein
VLGRVALVQVLAVPLAVVAFHSSVQPLPAPLRKAVTTNLWHRGCPVAPSGLRLLTVSYWGFDGHAHSGRLVVGKAWARPLARVFRRLFELRFPIRKMRPVETSGDDTASFECRDAAPSPCPGSSPSHSWSEHAYGEAIDLNPIENPYTGCGVTRERASIPYLDRSHPRKGMVTPEVVSAFRAIGWGWGGDWVGVKDYMHFSASGH